MKDMRVSLIEIETQWSMVDVLEAGVFLDIREDVEIHSHNLRAKK